MVSHGLPLVRENRIIIQIVKELEPARFRLGYVSDMVPSVSPLGTPVNPPLFPSGC